MTLLQPRDQLADRGAAMRTVQEAVADGRLVKPEGCSNCGRIARSRASRIEAHHFLGYEFDHWLDIRWLCVTCHVDAHTGGPFTPRTADSWWGLRNARGWSLRDVQRRTGINIADLSRIERGMAGVRPEQAMALLAIYDEADIR